MFLYEMQWWEILAVVRGYRKRTRDMLKITRWQTWCLCRTWGAKVESETDMITFPWERENGGAEDEAPDDDEVARTREMLKEWNKKASRG